MTSKIPKEDLQIYYDSQRKEYLRKNPKGRWQAFGDRAITERLVAMGYSYMPTEKANPLNECDLIRHYITDHNDVVYSGEVAGHLNGFYEKDGVRYLVTDDPKIIEPTKGEWKTIETVLFNMLGNNQFNIFKAWLGLAAKSLRSGNFGNQQALAIAGEAGCGKTFIQNHIIKSCLGGRSRKAGLYLTGNTNFNADLFEAELLVLDDEFVSHKITDRLALGAKIKKIVASWESESLHGKGRKALPISPFWRIVLTLNDNPESLQVLPPLNEDIAEKMIIFKAFKKPFPLPMNTNADREHFRKVIDSEIPAFLFHIMNEVEIAPEMIDTRYGIKSYQHPEIVEALNDLSPEASLWLLIKKWAEVTKQDSIKIEPLALKDALLQDARTVSEAKALNLEAYANKTAILLGRLATQYPLNFTKPKNNKYREWIITIKSEAEKELEFFRKMDAM